MDWESERFEYETTNLDDTTNRVLDLYVEYTGNEEGEAEILAIDIFDEGENVIQMTDLNLWDQKRIVEKLLEELDGEKAYTAWCALQESKIDDMIDRMKEDYQASYGTV